MRRGLLLAFLCVLAAAGTAAAGRRAYDTAYEFTVRYYPRWFTWTQLALVQSTNRLGGPIGMGPDYRIVVAINDDTIYVSGFLDLSAEPQILTLPAYPHAYSILQLDVFGNVLETGLAATPNGESYALAGPGYDGAVPDGLVRVDMPVDSSILILRIDKYTSAGVHVLAPAELFRESIQLQGLADFQTDSTGGHPFLLPLSYFSPPVKRMADETIEVSPVRFLETLQEAMESPTTRPLGRSDRTLIRRFGRLLEKANKQARSGSSVRLGEIVDGARDAHAAIIDRWHSNTGSTNWIHFHNIGHWGKSYLDRAALTEYIQYGNDRDAAYYAHAFVDGNGIPLDGSMYSYTVKFSAEKLPQAKRFWSVTAYTPVDVELVPNAADKYVVASYTPGLVTAPDGSVTIHVQPDQPTLTPTANWLPVPAGPFNLMLRVYGPEGTAADGTYVPPAIQAHDARF